MPRRPAPVCEYCRVISPIPEAETCLACGAPLPPVNASVAPALSVVEGKQSPAPQKISARAEVKSPYEDLRTAGERADEAYTHLLYAYGLFWRVLADSFVIALGGLALGLLAGALGLHTGWGLLAGASLGAIVAWVVKGYLLTVIGVPAGILVGALLAALPWLLGMPAAGVFFIVWAGALAGGWLGGLRPPFGRRRWPEKLRPFLGALGGLAMAALGLALGAGLRSAVAAWLG